MSHCQITLSVNAGVALHLGAMRVWSDALHDRRVVGFSTVTPERWNILQAHPDVKVVCCIGGGGAAGSNEAFKAFYGDEVPDDAGIFAADCTDEEQEAMKNGEFNRMSVAITGSPRTNADVIYDILVKAGHGEEQEHNIYRELIPVTVDNIDEVFGAAE